MKTKTKKSEAAIAVASTSTSASQPATQVHQVASEKILLLPSAQNGRVLQAWAGIGSTDLSTIADELRKSSKELINGDMKVVEAMLFDQAVALQAIFTTMAVEASKADYLSRMDPLLRLALKAQCQSRATLETLAMIKNPPIVYARQANISNGPQQVNNGALQSTHGAHAAKVVSSPTELFQEQLNEQSMDPRTTGTPRGVDVEIDSHLAAVGAIDRPENRSRKGAQQEQSVPRSSATKDAKRDAGVAVGDVRTSGGTRPSVKAAAGVPRMRVRRVGTRA